MFDTEFRFFEKTEEKHSYYYKTTLSFYTFYIM